MKKKIMACLIVSAFLTVVILSLGCVEKELTPEERVVQELEEVGYQKVKFSWRSPTTETNETIATVRMRVSSDMTLGVVQPYAGFHSMYYHLIREGDYTTGTIDYFCVQIYNPSNNVQSNWMTRPCHFQREIIIEANLPVALMDNENIVSLRITEIGDDTFGGVMRCSTLSP